MFSRLLKRSTLLLSATSAMSAMTKDSMNPEYIVRKVSLATGLPPAHHGPNGVFHNPWPSFSNRTFWDSMSVCLCVLNEYVTLLLTLIGWILLTVAHSTEARTHQRSLRGTINCTA